MIVILQNYYYYYYLAVGSKNQHFYEVDAEHEVYVPCFRVFLLFVLFCFVFVFGVIEAKKRRE